MCLRCTANRWQRGNSRAACRPLSHLATIASSVVIKDMGMHMNTDINAHVCIRCGGSRRWSQGPHFRDERKIKYKSRNWHGCEGVDEDI